VQKNSDKVAESMLAEALEALRTLKIEKEEMRKMRRFSKKDEATADILIQFSRVELL
jgi:Holliday junction resolvase